MSGTSGYQTPDSLAIPYVCPSNIPNELKPYFQQIYNCFQMMINTLITDCGIGPLSASQILGNLDNPDTILQGNMGRFYIQASENISYGAAINLYSSGGNLEVRNASAASSSTLASGFCSNSEGITSGSVGEVMLCGGIISAFTGLTVGAEYYLSNTAGEYSTTAGTVSQYLGIALSSTTILVRQGALI